MDTQQNKSAASAAGNASSASRSQVAAPAASAAAPSGSASSQPAAEQQPSSFIDTAFESGRTALDSALESGRTALDSGKKWIEDAHIRETVDQLPQSVKDWSGRAAVRVNSLSTTQKVVGGALLAASAAGLSWLALRKGKSAEASSDDSQGARSVYGRSGSFTRTGSAGYQAPDASNRRPAVTNRPSSMPSFGGSPSSQPSGSVYHSSDDKYRSVE